MDVKPGVLMMIGGGVLMFLGSFLDWLNSFTGFDIDRFGLQGIFVLFMGAAVAAVGGIRGFAPQVNLPSEILGLSLSKVVVVFGLSAFLICFGLMFVDGDTGIGLFLGWIGGALAVAGAIMEPDPSTATL